MNTTRRPNAPLPAMIPAGPAVYRGLPVRIDGGSEKYTVQEVVDRDIRTGELFVLVENWLGTETKVVSRGRLSLV